MKAPRGMTSGDWAACLERERQRRLGRMAFWCLAITAALVLCWFAAGCSSLPKDGYIRNAQITTPWGTTSIEVGATGAAARNLTKEERDAILAPVRK